LQRKATRTESAGVKQTIETYSSFVRPPHTLDRDLYARLEQNNYSSHYASTNAYLP